MGFVEYWRANHIELARPIIIASMGEGQPMQSTLMESFMPMMSRVFDTALRTYYRQSGPNHAWDLFTDPNFNPEQLMYDDRWT